MLQYPKMIEEEMHLRIGQLVHILHAEEAISVPVPPKTFVLGLVPFRMITETDAEWVVAAVSGWDDTVDMSPFCLDHAQCTEYLVKAVVYHVHPLEAQLTCDADITSPTSSMATGGISPTTLKSILCS